MSEIYVHGYCEECWTRDCDSPWCELDRRGWDLYLEYDAIHSDVNPFELRQQWYFYDADSGRHGPFPSELAARDAACEWLDDVEQVKARVWG